MKCLGTVILLWLATVNSLPATQYDSDSLKPVIRIIEKREKELEPLYVLDNEPEEEIIFIPEDYGQPEDIGYGYQKSLPSELANFKEHYPYLSNEELEKLMLDYLEKGRPKDDYYVYGKAKKSVFRERDDSDYPDNLQNLIDNDEYEKSYKNQSPFRERFRDNGIRGNAKSVKNADLEYLSALNTLWEQYHNKNSDLNNKNDEDYDVPPLGNDNVELSEDDIAAILSYFEDKSSDDDDQNETYKTDDSDDYPVIFIKNDKYSKNKHHSKTPQKRIWRDGAFESYPGYDNPERFLIKKRSLKTIHDDLKRKKKSLKQNELSTDKELNKIFGNTNKKNETEFKNNKPTLPTIESKNSETITTTTTKPILLKKKSTDWSNYFGYDKRKKKSYNDHWIAEKYVNKYETPVNQPIPKDMDSQFRDMEDDILDKVIKYTGSQEGVSSSEQLRKIKQKIMTQLAAAYNLEKMRKTYGEKKYTEKRIAIKKELTGSKDSGVTLEGESNNNIPEGSHSHQEHPQYVKKSFFRRNNPKYSNYRDLGF